MARQFFAVMFIVALSAPAAWGQGPGPGRPGRMPGPGFGPPLGGIDVLAAEPPDLGSAVAGSPFRAEMATEIIQELSDGNRIEFRTTSSMARDGSGRIRHEQTLPPVGPIMPNVEVRIVTISDPVLRTLYLLDPNRKTALKSALPRGPRIGTNPRGADPRGRPDRAGIVSEPIGVREVAGVRAEGTRSTTTIPAGAFGNVRPIKVVDERWYSPELKLVLESKRTDPRSGTVEYHVTSLVRGEPSPELFQLPSDYAVTEHQPPPFGPRPGPPR